MSLYWQQALPNGDPNGAQQNDQQQQGQTGQWDYVSLGGAPAPQYQWGQYAQSNENTTQRGGNMDPYSAAAFGGYNQKDNQQQMYQYQNAQQQHPQQQSYQQVQMGSNQQAAPMYDQSGQYSSQSYDQQQQQQMQHTPILSKQSSPEVEQKQGNYPTVAVDGQEELHYWNYQQQQQPQQSFNGNLQSIPCTNQNSQAHPQYSAINTGWTAAHAHFAADSAQQPAMVTEPARHHVPPADASTAQQPMNPGGTSSAPQQQVQRMEPMQNYVSGQAYVPKAEVNVAYNFISGLEVVSEEQNRFNPAQQGSEDIQAVQEQYTMSAVDQQAVSVPHVYQSTGNDQLATTNANVVPTTIIHVPRSTQECTPVDSTMAEPSPMGGDTVSQQNFEQVVQEVQGSMNQPEYQPVSTTPEPTSIGGFTASQQCLDEVVQPGRVASNVPLSGFASTEPTTKVSPEEETNAQPVIPSVSQHVVSHPSVLPVPLNGELEPVLCDVEMMSDDNKTSAVQVCLDDRSDATAARCPPSTGGSSQVTPESSSYSVDTFSSQDRIAQTDAAAASCAQHDADKTEDWDDWEKAGDEEETTTLHENSPSIRSETQSEPAGFYVGGAGSTVSSREPSAAPSNGWERDATPQSHLGTNGPITQDLDAAPLAMESQPVVAQVAPLVKKLSSEPAEQPIARVEPVSQQSIDSPSNVQRVAPTRPIVTAAAVPEQEAPVPAAPVVVDLFAPLEYAAVDTPAETPQTMQPASQHRVEDAAEQEVAQPNAELAPTETPSSTSTAVTSTPAPSEETNTAGTMTQVTVTRSSTSPSTASLAPPAAAVNESSTTPDQLMTSETESPGQAQATSTPVTAAAPAVTEQDVQRSISSRRNSSSSIRSGMMMSQSKTMPQISASGEHSDSTQGSLSFTRNNNGIRGSYHERYRGVKEKYLDSRSEVSQVMQRLDRHRVETPRVKKTNPLVDMSLSTSGRRSVQLLAAAGARSGVNLADVSMDGGSVHQGDKLNLSGYSQLDSSLNQSIDISKMSAGYGEDFVDASRRSRLNRSRPASRAKSEIGENGPYRGSGRPANGYEYGAYAGMHHPQQQYYQQQHGGAGYHSMGRHSGRLSAAAMPYHQEYYQQQQMMYPDYRRAQSTYDQRAMERFQRAGGNLSSYDTFNAPPPDEDDDEESLTDDSELDEDEDELEQGGGESEDEMRRYNMARGLKPSRSGYSMASSHHAAAGMQMPMPRQARYGQEESYYFGIIRLEQGAVDVVFRHMPPPREFYSLLQPHEKAAYLYYASVYNKLFSSVAEFQNKFNREFYKFVCDGDSKNTALCKICKSMFDEYNLKRLTNQQKAYEASQKQLFSDDRDSADGLSDRASMYDKEDDLDASDIMSIDTSQRAPLKHRTPHAFVTFGPGGKMVTVDPDVSVSMVQIDDVKKVLQDNHSKRLIDAAQMFRGPLIEGKTPAHSVRLYIQRQIERVRSSEVASENPRDNDVIDCLLVWQLLEMVVQQQGRVTGPDVARLLIAAGSSSARTQQQHSHHREKSSTPQTSSESVVADRKQTDPRAYERFTQFLLGGHVDEAVECAIQDGLYADAMVLARRLFAGDERRLGDIEARFLATRPATNPVMTLVSVASGQPAPILTNPPVDDTGSWRTHAAMVLANLNTSHAMQTVYGLGRVLAKREYNAAADFCLLAVALLSSFDIFQPVPQQGDEDASVRQHITLIHASLPDDEWDSTQCRYGFSLTDLHATEIFDYAIRLAQRPSPLQNSVDFQRKRFQYAKLLADYGGFSTDSFRYCLSVASSIWGYYHMLTAVELNELADLADRLRFSAAEDATDTQWIDSLRGMIAQMPQSSGLMTSSYQGQQQQPDQQQQDHHQQQQVEQPAQPAVDVMENNPLAASRSRSESLATEARDWHADHQAPLQMSPQQQQQGRDDAATPGQALGDMVVTSPAMTEYQTPRERVSSVSQQRRNSQQPPTMSYGEQLCQVQQNTSCPSETVTSSSGGHDDDTSGATTTPTSTEETNTSSENSPARQRQSSLSLPEMPPQMAFTPVSPPQPQQQQQQQQYEQQRNSQPPSGSSAQPPQQQNQHKQQQQAPQQQPKQQQPPPAQSMQNGSATREPVGDLKKNNGSTGMLAKFLRKVIPDSSSMILPDDKNPQIRWDAAQNRWVGDGVEEETAAAPPPKADPQPCADGSVAPPTIPSGGGLRAARVSGGSRYFNPLTASNGASSAPSPVPDMPSMPIPTSFSFIPTMPDNAESVDPFSVDSNPSGQDGGQSQETSS